MKLSKFAVKRFINKIFENSNMGREVCFAELDVGSNNSLAVASSHLESQTHPEMNSSKRIAQAKGALSHLSNFPNVVFGGDMNWDENSDGPFPLYGDWIDAWTELRPAENGWTYDTKDNKSLRGYRPLQKRLDRFLCKLMDFEINDIVMIGMEAIPGLSYRHGNKVNPVYPSDHFGLLLTISAL